MKVPHVIAEIVSEFSGFNHTPDFKASRSTGNFEEEDGATSSDAQHHHQDEHHEHHGHSLYLGKHLKKLATHAEVEEEPDAHSNHSTGSHEKKHHKHHGLTVHFKDFFHIGHHHHNYEHDKSATPSGASTPARKLSGASQPHKHSINLTVGAEEVPTFIATPPNEPNHAHFVKNGSPCISRVASNSSLREKLNRIKRTTSSDSETDFPEKKCSVASYRVVSH